MTINDYQKDALRTEQVSDLDIILLTTRGTSKDFQSMSELFELKNSNQLMNGLMGLNGEAGEAIDILKKYLFQGHKLDREHLAKELGDVAWYLAISADALGYTLEDILKMNVEKRRERYPNGFEVDKSVNRKDGDL